MAAAVLRRLIAELFAVSSPRDVDATFARLRVRVVGDEAVVGDEGDEGDEGDGDAIREGGGLDALHSLDSLGAGSVAVVRIAPGIYARTPTVDGRVRLLALAARAARENIELHVVVADDQSHRGRLAIDLPRRVLRAVGVPAADPGDRFGPERYAHCFFDEETLLDELRRAGLALSARHGFVFTLRRLDPHEERAPEERAEPFAVELARVLRHVRAIDERRTKDTPQRILDELRRRGATSKERGPIGRARLRRAIGWVDAMLPGGASCYRRVLLELALDAGAARETVVFGLDVGSTGHVAFEDREERAFDVAFAIVPSPSQGRGAGAMRA
jgi:hypothetical protein